MRKSTGSSTAADRLGKFDDLAQSGNWDWDIVNNELLWSTRVFPMFGLTPQTFGSTYDAFLDTVHPEDREMVKEAVDVVFIRGKVHSRGVFYAPVFPQLQGPGCHG